MKNALKAGTVLSIALRDLPPHPLAQRRFDAARAEKIAAEFDPARFGIPTVAETPKKKRFVVDGQTRIAAALKWLNGDGSQCVDCMVIPVEGDSEAADLFLGLNDHKKVSALDKFMVRVVAKDAQALAVVAILDSVGLRVDRSRADGVVQAVDACESVLTKQRGALLLERNIRILHSAWGNDSDAYNGMLIRGTALLIVKHGTAVDDEELVRKLAKRGGPLGLIGRARELKSAMGGSVPQAVYECLRNEYNKGRRTEKLEDKAA